MDEQGYWLVDTSMFSQDQKCSEQLGRHNQTLSSITNTLLNVQFKCGKKQWYLQGYLLNSLESRDRSQRWCSGARLQDVYVHNFPFLPETTAECCSVWHIKLSLNLTLYFLRMKRMQLIVLLLSTTFFSHYFKISKYY